MPVEGKEIAVRPKGQYLKRNELLEDLIVDFRSRMKKHGVSFDVLAKHLKEELSATSKKSFYDSKRGDVVYADPDPDWGARREARRDACKLFGLFEDRGEDKNYTLNFFTTVVESADPLKAETIDI